MTEDLEANARAVYDRIAYGATEHYTGEIEYGGAKMTELDISQFTDPDTKNADDLVVYVTQAWESGWGYVWGTFGQTLTESLFESQGFDSTRKALATMRTSFAPTGWVAGPWTAWA